MKGYGGWNNSSLSRRSNTVRGLLSTRTPQSTGNSGGGIPNPSLGIGVISEAMPKLSQRIVRNAGVAEALWRAISKTDGSSLNGPTTGNSQGRSVALKGTGDIAIVGSESGGAVAYQDTRG